MPSLSVSTILIRFTTSQSSCYPIVRTCLGGPRSRPNTHLKLRKGRESNPRPRARHADQWCGTFIKSCYPHNKMLSHLFAALVWRYIWGGKSVSVLLRRRRVVVSDVSLRHAILRDATPFIPCRTGVFTA